MDPAPPLAPSPALHPPGYVGRVMRGVIPLAALGAASGALLGLLSVAVSRRWTPLPCLALAGLVLPLVRLVARVTSGGAPARRRGWLHALLAHAVASSALLGILLDGIYLDAPASAGPAGRMEAVIAALRGAGPPLLLLAACLGAPYGAYARRWVLARGVDELGRRYEPDERELDLAGLAYVLAGAAALGCAAALASALASPDRTPLGEAAVLGAMLGGSVAVGGVLATGVLVWLDALSDAIGRRLLRG